jgi:hypothetical protein
MKFAVNKCRFIKSAEPISHNCVTTQMTLDAKGTGMTLTGPASVSGLAKSMIGIS